MPLRHLIIILSAVIIAAGLTIWALSATMLAQEVSPQGVLVIMPAVLLAAVLVRVIIQRTRKRQDDPDRRR